MIDSYASIAMSANDLMLRTFTEVEPMLKTVYDNQKPLMMNQTFKEVEPMLKTVYDNQKLLVMNLIINIHISKFLWMSNNYI